MVRAHLLLVQNLEIAVTTKFIHMFIEYTLFSNDNVCPLQIQSSPQTGKSILLLIQTVSKIKLSRKGDQSCTLSVPR